MRSHLFRVLHDCSIYLKSRKFCLYGPVFGLVLGLVSNTAIAHEAQVYGGTGCVDATGLQAQITELLGQFSPNREDTQDLTARMALSLRGQNLSVSLKLTDLSGRIALARRYQLHKNDCPDVPDLLKLVLQEFLREFPENPWQAAKEVDAPNLDSRAPADIALRLGVSLLSEVNPGGAKLETNAHLQGPLGGPVQWQTGLQLRASLPQDVFDGGYQRLEFLFGAGIAIKALQTVWDIQLLGGGYVLSGQSFVDNRTALAPALEVNLGARWYWQALSFGPTLSVCLLKHQVQVLPENTEVPISNLNLGLTIQYDIK